MSIAQLINTSPSDMASPFHFQRKLAYDGTKWWAFYWDGSNYVYRYSYDLYEWSAPATLWSIPPYGRAGALDVRISGNVVYVVGMSYSAPWYNVHFRRGVINGTTITWGDIKTIYRDSYYMVGLGIEKLLGGWILVVFHTYAYGEAFTYSRDEGGFWYPLELGAPSASTTTGGTTCVRRLNNNALIVVKDASDDLYWTYFTAGGSATPIRLVRNLASGWGSFALASYGNKVHLVYLTAKLVIEHTMRNESWSGAVAVQSGVTATSRPCLTVDNITGDVYCFWAGSPLANRIYYKKRTASTGLWDASPTVLTDESAEVLTSNDRITSFYETFAGKRGVMLMTKTASPYNVKTAWHPYYPLIQKANDETYLLTEEGLVQIIIPAIDKFGEETYPIYEVSGGFKTPHVMPKIFAPVPIAIHSGISFVTRNSEIPHERKARDMGRNPIILTTDGKKAHRALREIRPRYGFKVIRGGEVVYRRWEGADLLVWRGQMSLAYLISQGSTGSAVGAFMLVASENDTMPDMGHDSGDPEANEFSPVIGTPITGTWWFEPTVKPTGQYQLSGWLFYEGDVVADRDCTLRKMGIIDTTPTPNRRIITEDRVVDVPILLNDLIRIRYFFPLG